jgi:hypothetical protein
VWRLLRPLLRFWTAVVFSALLGTAVNALFGPIRPGVLACFYTNWPWELGLIVLLGGLTLGAAISQRRKQQQEAVQQRWQQKEEERREEAEAVTRFRQQFALVKVATALQPEDFGFQRLAPGQSRNPHMRPFYPAYLSRKVTPHPSVAEHVPDVEWTEDRLAQHLQHGMGFILIGQPLDGKSRTLYEVLKRLEGYDIVKPFKDRPLPSDEAFSIICVHLSHAHHRALVYCALTPRSVHDLLPAGDALVSSKEREVAGGSGHDRRGRATSVRDDSATRDHRRTVHAMRGE